MSEIVNCQLCGEPMPKGEEMFNYHGYSGPCPKPPMTPPVVQMAAYAITAADDAAPTPGWIRLTPATLPPPNPNNPAHNSVKVLLCTAKGRRDVARYWYKSDWWSSASIETTGEGTFWRPLPAPPTEGQ